MEVFLGFGLLLWVIAVAFAAVNLENKYDSISFSSKRVD